MSEAIPNQKKNGHHKDLAEGLTPPPPSNAAPATPTAPAATVHPLPAPAAPETKPHPLSHLPLPFQSVDFAQRGVHLEATVTAAEVVSAAEQLDQLGFSLDTITGVDWMAQAQMEVIYDYFHSSRNLRVAVRARIPRENPEIPTISNVFPGANWHERETHDFFAIRFTGHPDLTPFLLPEDATYHPLRKDFAS
jgi:NADH-quinone oxidoreductase subunit C